MSENNQEQLVTSLNMEELSIILRTDVRKLGSKVKILYSLNLNNPGLPPSKIHVLNILIGSGDQASVFLCMNEQKQYFALRTEKITDDSNKVRNITNIQNSYAKLGLAPVVYGTLENQSLWGKMGTPKSQGIISCEEKGYFEYEADELPGLENGTWQLMQYNPLATDLRNLLISGRYLIKTEDRYWFKTLDLDMRFELLSDFIDFIKSYAQKAKDGNSHNDLKPTNTLVHWDEKKQKFIFVLIDFSLVDNDESPHSSVQDLSNPSAKLSGTPTYMSLNHVKNRKEDDGSINILIMQIFAYCLAGEGFDYNVRDLIEKVIAGDQNVNEWEYLDCRKLYEPIVRRWLPLDQVNLELNKHIKNGLEEIHNNLKQLAISERNPIGMVNYLYNEFLNIFYPSEA